MKLMFITNDANIAKEAEIAGVDRIFIDLEINGKKERQGHLDTHIANHNIKDIRTIKNELSSANIIVRVNPYYENTFSEVNKCINYGADIIMLPMFKKVNEVKSFIEAVSGRARVCLLLETAQALVRINEILELDGIDEIHVGLNDLHLSLGLDFMFELLTSDIIDYLAKKIKEKEISFGFGGIAKIGEGLIPAELILGEHYRLRSEMVILSRSFRADLINENNCQSNLVQEIKKVRSFENDVEIWSDIQFLENREIIKKKVKEIVQKR